MRIETHRFGPMDIPNDKIINMERPILGFENLSAFCLIEMEEVSPFLWMQSIEDPQIAFLVVNPVTFFPDYRIEINSQEIAELTVSDPTEVETYVITTIESERRDVTANLQGPVLINTTNNKAKQLVLVNSRYKVCHSIAEVLDNAAPGSKTDEPAREMVSV